MNKLIRVGPGRIITMRYVMRNAAHNVLINTLEQEPVKFTYGSGEILPGLEEPLAGLKVGEQKSFSLSATTNPDLDQTFFFDVIIDDICWPTEHQSDTVRDLKTHINECGPDCTC